MVKLTAAQGCAHKSLPSFVNQLLARAAAPSTPRFKTRITTTIEQLESRMMLSATLLTTTPDFVLAQDGTATPAASSSITGMTAAKARKAYGLDAISFSGVVGDGTGQTIAIVDAYDAPNIVADLHAFDLAMGLSDPTLTVVKQAGTVADAKGGWGVEINLDVEWAHVVAPNANILLVEAKSASYTDLMAAVDTASNTPGVTAVSMSWGSTEFSGDLTYDSHFVTPAGHAPITYFTASGDNGAYNNGGTTKAAGYPSVSPRVVAVGGTYLSTDSTGTYLSEKGWGNGTSSGSLGGSGGGISVYTAKPTYQSTVTQSATKRTVPDVAFLADPASGAAVYDSYDFGSSTPWAAIGGTSLASPMWAGLMAIINQGRALQGKASMDGFSETLPALYALPSSDYHDITTGNNGFAAAVGYDLVTGRGTPIANLLAVDMANYGNAAGPTPVIGSFVASPSSVVTGTSTTLTATGVTESGGTISSVKFYRDSDGTAGLNTATDTLVGTGVANGTTYTLAAATTGFVAGTYTYYAVAADAAAVTTTASTTLTVTAAPQPVIASLTLNPTSVVTGTSSTLTASGVTDSGSTISTVKFYRDSDGTAGLNTATDTLLGTGAQNGTTWTIAAATTGFATGTYDYYAVATDAAAVSAMSSKATLTVTSAPTPNPIIGSFSLSPTSVVLGGTTVLTAANVTDAGSTISTVKFYRDSDGTAGLNTATDSLVGTGAQNGTTWTFTAPTTGLAAGNYDFYAVATDAATVSTTSLKATLTITNQITTGLLAGWSVTGQTGYGTQGLKAATVANVTNSTGLTRGAGVSTGGTAASNAWGGIGWSSKSAAGITAGDTVTFGLTVSTGKTVSLSSINLNYRRSKSGSKNGLWQYQLNGGTWITFADVSNEFSSTNNGGAVMTTLNTTAVAGLQNLAAGTVVNIRLTPYGASNSSGTWYVYDRTGNDLAISGTTVSSAAVIAKRAFAADASVSTTADLTVVPTTFSETPVTGDAVSASSNVEVADVKTHRSEHRASASPFASSPIAFSGKLHWASHKPSHASSASSGTVSLEDPSVGLINWELL